MTLPEIENLNVQFQIWKSECVLPNVESRLRLCLRKHDIRHAVNSFGIVPVFGLDKKYMDTNVENLTSEIEFESWN